MFCMEEIWKDVPDYEGIYLISTLGNVKSLDREIYEKDGTKRPLKGKFIKSQKTGNGYKFVCLYKNGVGKMAMIHRLVAKAFIPNPENKKEVNHKDGVKTNNVLSNLEWATRAENQLHSHRTKLLIMPKGSENKFSKKFGQYDKTGQLIKVWVGIKATARELNINASWLSSALNGREQTLHGYVWKFIDGV